MSSDDGGVDQDAAGNGASDAAGAGSGSSASEADASASEARARTTTENGEAGISPDASGYVPTDLPPSEVGKGLFADDMAPSSAFAHLYRGEVHRMNRWRVRLDRTTKWGVMMSAAVVTYAFSSSTQPHFIVLIGIGTLLTFLGMEAHRYRAYDVWRSRVRLLQENAIAPGLDPSHDVDDENWRRQLARDYRKPEVKITFEEALAHRLRRVYLPLLFLLVATWAAHVSTFGNGSLPESAAIGAVPGILVLGAIGTVVGGAVVVAFRPREWQAKGELRDRNIAAWDD
ncbi:DUF2270 domain-containing protein [Haloparvum sp. AD34]